MKHAIVKIFVVVCGVVAMARCSRTTIIPDKDLERITREMFLVNAYANSEKVKTDSLDIYTPILERYGYTQDDFFNTLANFQKRKSARLGDVIEAAIASLERLADGYEQKLRDLKYIDSLAKAQCREEVFFVDKIVARKFRDTTKLQLTIPIHDSGEYILSYYYYIDSLDKNTRLQSNLEIYTKEGIRTYLSRPNLTREDTIFYSTTLRPKKGAEELRLTLADYTRREDAPHIRFDSIRVIYLPSSEVALAHMDSVLSFRPMLLFNDSIRVRGYFDAKPPRVAHDTLWLRIDSLDMVRAEGLRLGADSLDGEGEKLTKEVERLLSRGEKLREKAAKGKFRNDSLRQVAHLRNVAEADSLATVADSLRGAVEVLRGEALGLRTTADSIDIVLWGEVTAPHKSEKQEK